MKNGFNNIMNIELLEEIGLTKSEVKVYLALLELGSSSTGKIIDKSKASSSKIYEILDRLMQKGLASFIIKSGIKYFEAASPQRIMDYMKEKERKFNEQKSELKKLLPELELKRTISKYKSEATVFKGMKGMETAFNDVFKVLKKGDTMYVYVVGEVEERMNDFFIRHYTRRSKVGIKTKTIFSEAGRKWYELRKHIKNFEGKVIPSQSTSPATICVYGAKTLIRIGNPDDLINVLIDNENCAKAFLQQFEELWDQHVNVYRGFNDVTNKFWSMLGVLKKGEEYYVLGATYGKGGKKLQDWFMRYHSDRVKRGIKVKLLSVPDDYQQVKYQMTHTGDPNMNTSEVKKHPYDFSNPMQINLYKGNKVLMFLFGEEMICFEIESEILYQNFKNYFDVLWPKK